MLSLRPKKVAEVGDVILYDYWRSSAAYRVRIALNLKKIDYTTVPVDLLQGEHKSAAHLQRHPQGIVPALAIDGQMLNQSLAIIEYLDETRPHIPLLPDDPAERARVRTLSYAIAMEIHPVCNLSVATHVSDLVGCGDRTKTEWMQKYIYAGLAAFEERLTDHPTRTYCHGDRLTMADCCLIPQVYNAKRWGVDYLGFKQVCRIDEICSMLSAFQDAHPDKCKK